MKYSIDNLVEKTVLIRTVTHYFVGKLLETGEFFTLNNASWIAETAQWNKTAQQGKLNESYPYNPETVVFVNRESIVDIFEWPFELPTKVICGGKEDE
jgi:hypothetical protein